MTWKPLPSVPPGELLPCGANPDGTIREFFANAADIDYLIRDGITVVEYGAKVRFRVSLTSTPFYANGDVQIRAEQHNRFSPVTATPSTRSDIERRDGLDTGGAFRDAA